MKQKKLTKPMRTIRQNYWRKGNEHIIPRWLDTKVIDPKPMQIKLKREYHDTDLDGVPNFQDCNIWNPYEQGWIHDQAAKVYNRLRESKLSRKRRVLAENKKDRREPLYLPPSSSRYQPEGLGFSHNTSSHRESNIDRLKRYGSRAYADAKEFTSKERAEARKEKIVGFGKRMDERLEKIKGSKPVGFAKGVYKTAQQFNPETRITPGTYFVWVLKTIHDQAGNVVAQDWVDTGERYTSKEQVRQVFEELTRRGFDPREIKIENKPAPTSRHWKENVQAGLAIKKEPRTPVAHVMIHPGPGMVSQPQQQQQPSQTRSSFGYSPGFVGATKKQFRVGGDR